MITEPKFTAEHLPHRRSILEEYIQSRTVTSRPGFNCYIDAALITIRALCGLLGFETDSRSVTDMADPTQPTVKFGRFSAIRANLDPRIVIANVQSVAELTNIPEWKEIVISLSAANKCVAHVDEYSDLDHAATPAIVEIAARAVLREVDKRITIQA